MKKLLIGFAVLAALFLAGCSAGSPNPTAPASGGQATSTWTPPPKTTATVVRISIPTDNSHWVVIGVRVSENSPLISRYCVSNSAPVCYILQPNDRIAFDDDPGYGRANNVEIIGDR